MSTTQRTHGHGGISVLLLVAIVVIAFAPVAFIFRAGFLPRRRAPRQVPHPDPDGAASPDVEAAPHDGVPPAVSHDATARASTDLDEVSSNEVENGDVAFNLGILLYERGHLGSAEAAWRRAAELHHAQAATRLGMALEQRGDVDAARVAYRDAERWGDTDASERSAALRRPHRPGAQSRPAEERVSE